jgi:hypothetical protein
MEEAMVKAKDQPIPTGGAHKGRAEIQPQTVHHLVAESIASAPVKLGEPDIGIRLSFVELGEIQTALNQAMAALKKAKQRVEGQLQDLTPAECRVADWVFKRWPDGRVPGESFDWFTSQMQQDIPDAPEHDVVGRALKKLKKAKLIV